LVTGEVRVRDIHAQCDEALQ